MLVPTSHLYDATAGQFSIEIGRKRPAERAGPDIAPPDDAPLPRWSEPPADRLDLGELGHVAALGDDDG